MMMVMMMMMTNINESQQRRTYPTSLHTRVGVKILTDALYFLVDWEAGDDSPLVKIIPWLMMMIMMMALQS